MNTHRESVTSFFLSGFLQVCDFSVICPVDELETRMKVKITSAGLVRSNPKTSSVTETSTNETLMSPTPEIIICHETSINPLQSTVRAPPVIKILGNENNTSSLSAQNNACRSASLESQAITYGETKWSGNSNSPLLTIGINSSDFGSRKGTTNTSSPPALSNNVGNIKQNSELSACQVPSTVTPIPPRKTNSLKKGKKKSQETEASRISGPPTKGKTQKKKSTKSASLPVTILSATNGSTKTTNVVTSGNTTAAGSSTVATTVSGYTVIHVPHGNITIPLPSNNPTNGKLPFASQLSTNASVLTTSSLDQAPRVAAKVTSNKLLLNKDSNSTAPNTCVVSKPGKGKRISSSQELRHNLSTGASTSSTSTTHNNTCAVGVTHSPSVLSLRHDILCAFHGFGGIRRIDNESLKLVEDIIKQEIQGFVCLCEEAAKVRGAKGLGFIEAIYVLRREKFRLHLLFNYFSELEIQDRRLADNKTGYTQLKFMKEIRAAVEELDSAGELIRILENECSDILAEDEKIDQLDFRMINSTSPKFLKYITALSVSFAMKFKNMQDWCSKYIKSQTKFNPHFVEILTFLTYELLAQIVGSTLIVSKEQMRFTESVQLTGPLGLNPDTCMSEASYQRKRKDDETRSVSEILVQASEMEAKRLKRVDPAKDGIPGSVEICGSSFNDVTTSEIEEAYRRYRSSTLFPSASYWRRAKTSTNYFRYPKWTN